MGLSSVPKKHCFFMYYFNFDWDHFSMLLVRGPLLFYFFYNTLNIGVGTPIRNGIGANK